MGKCRQIDYLNDKGKKITLNFTKPKLIAYLKNGGYTMYVFDDNRKKTDKLPSWTHKKKFEIFNFKPSSQAYTVRMDIPQTPHDLLRQGLCVYEVYLSDKDNTMFGENQGYEHFHKKPYPTLYKYKKTYIISGGRMKIVDWIYN